METTTTGRTPVLLAVTPPRTGERTLLGVENLLQSIAVPEPFSLELTGDMDGVTLMTRCLDDRVVRAQLSAHYPHAPDTGRLTKRTTPCASKKASRRGPSRCGPTAPSTCPFAPSATTTSSTPAPTP